MSETNPPGFVPRFQEVPPEKLLTPLRVWQHANLASQVVLTLLVLCCAVALALWVWRVVRRQPSPTADPLAAFVSSVAFVAPVLGLAMSAWAILKVCIGSVNELPTPGLLDLMPGFAEAAMAALVGLAASSFMLVLRGHLKVRAARTAVAAA